MKIGFVVLRITDIKIMGELIQKTDERGHQVALFFHAGISAETNDQSKDYLDLKEDALTSFSNCEQIKASSVEEIFADAYAWSPEYLFFIEGYLGMKAIHHLAALEESRERGIKTISLSHFYEIASCPLEALDFFDQTLYTSEFSRDLHFRVSGHGVSLTKLEKQYGDKYAIVGSPQFDPIPSISRTAARERWAIPQDKKVVLFFSPAILPTTPWRYQVWRDPRILSRLKTALRTGNWATLPEVLTSPSFLDALISIKASCEENDALLVVKSRGKHKDPDYLVDAADLYLDGVEDEYFPAFTPYQLLAAADLCIAAHSMSVLEAVAADVPVINIAVPPLDFAETLSTEMKKYMNVIFCRNNESPFFYPGCVHNIEWRDFPSWMRGRDWSNLGMDEQARRDYLWKYLGITEVPSSTRILNLLEERGH